MKREIIITILTICLIGALALGFYMYTNEMVTYAIVVGAVALVLSATLIIYITSTRSEEAIYRSTLKRTLNTYDAILVQSHNFPDLKGKNIIRVTNIDDLVDAQLEIRKPIYYMIEGEDSCSFVLLDNNEACIYVMKQNENVESPLELIVAEYEKHNDIDASLLEDIERTTIIKLNNMKSFKVSPYKRKKDIEQNEQTEKNIETTTEEKKDKEEKQQETKQETVEAVKNSNSDDIETI